jgi:hypothetical protein
MKQLLAWTGNADSTITSKPVMAMAEKFNTGQEVCWQTPSIERFFDKIKQFAGVFLFGSAKRACGLGLVARSEGGRYILSTDEGTARAGYGD